MKLIKLYRPPLLHWPKIYRTVQRYIRGPLLCWAPINPKKLVGGNFNMFPQRLSRVGSHICKLCFLSIAATKWSLKYLLWRCAGDGNDVFLVFIQPTNILFQMAAAEYFSQDPMLQPTGFRQQTLSNIVWNCEQFNMHVQCSHSITVSI